MDSEAVLAEEFMMFVRLSPALISCERDLSSILSIEEELPLTSCLAFLALFFFFFFTYTYYILSVAVYY